MPLVITSRTSDRVPISWRGFCPSTVAGASLAELERWTIAYGNRKVPVADLFALAGDATDGHWRLEGDFASVHYIGAGLCSGFIHAEGPLGRHVGSGMVGGRIEAQDDVGDYLGAEMRGGYMSVAGNAGDHVGAAYIGSKSGMRAGTILIEGNVGSHVGYAMRRGNLIVRGDCGEWPAYRMRGGTLTIGGVCGPRPGAETRRGTIVLTGEVPELLPTFRYACEIRPTTFDWLYRTWAAAGIQVPYSKGALFRLFNGDFNEGGRGELLVLAEA